MTVQQNQRQQNEPRIGLFFTIGGLIGLGLCAIPVFVPLGVTGFVVYIGVLLALHFVLAIVFGYFARRAVDIYTPEIKRVARQLLDRR